MGTRPFTLLFSSVFGGVDVRYQTNSIRRIYIARKCCHAVSGCLGFCSSIAPADDINLMRPKLRSSRPCWGPMRVKVYSL